MTNAMAADSIRELVQFLVASNMTPALRETTVVPGSTVMEECVNHQVALQRPVLVSVLMGIVRRHL